LNTCPYVLGLIFLNSRTRSIYQPTHQTLSTNIRSHTELLLFIFDSVRVITCLISQFSLHVMDGRNEHSWHKFCFKDSLSATEILVLAQKAYRNKALNQSNDFMGYLRFLDERELVEDDDRGGSPKSTRHCCCWWFSQKWSSNRIKNDSRIFEHPKTVVLRTVKEDFCSREFFMLRPPTKLQVFANFWPKKDMKPFIPPPGALHLYLRQIIFCSPGLNLSWKLSFRVYLSFKKP
jgi:hypothetical protein